MRGLGERLAALADPEAYDGGRVVAFTVTTENGKELRVNCAVDQLGDIFAFLGGLAKYATAEAPPTKSQSYLAPIPADGIGLAAGRRANEVVLTVRLSGFHMAFEVEKSAVARLADEFVQVARTLSTDDTTPKN